jgi:antitoxin Phd
MREIVAGIRDAAGGACQSAVGLIDETRVRYYLLASYLARKEPAMDGPEWSLQDAKNSFSAVVEAASKGTPQTVTKRGKPAVVVLSVAEYERLARKRTRKSFVEHLLAFPQGDGKFKFEGARLKPRDVKF